MDSCIKVKRGVTSELCIACQHCCRYDMLMVPDLKGLELAYHKGHTVLWEPTLRRWHIVLKRNCQYITDEGCSIYRHKRKPQLCVSWTCHLPGSIQKIHPILVDAGQRICKQLFGGKINAGTR